MNRRRSPAPLLLAALALAASAATAQDLTKKAPPQQAPIALVGGTVHPVRGAPIENGYVLFADGRLTAVGKMPGEFPENAVRIDCAGKHVYPGLIAPHTRLGLIEIGAVRATRDDDEVNDISPEVRAAVAVNPDSTLLPVTRRNGILTFATFPRGGLVPGRCSVMTMDGWTWEDMAVRADAGLVVRWPNPRPPHAWFADAEDEKAARARAEEIAHLREAFGAARAYLKARAADPGIPVDLRWEAMRPALAGERPVFFHADDYDAITTAVAFAAEQRLKAVLVGGRDTLLCADLLKQHDVAVVLDGVHRFPKRRDSDFDEVFRLPARLEVAGVRWCMASGEWNAAHERNLPYVAARAAAHGLSKAAALRSVTLSAAEILGVGEELGSLESGKRATLIVTTGDPLEVATDVEIAFIDGRRIDLSNKQTALAAKYRAKYAETK